MNAPHAAEHTLLVRRNLFAMLSKTNRAVSHCGTAAELYHEVCRIASETGQFYLAWIGEARGAQVEIVAVAGRDPRYTDHVVVSLDPADPRSRGPAGQAFLTGQLAVLNNFTTSPNGAPWHQMARSAGIEASAAFPLKEQGKVVAVLTVYATEADFFSDDVVEILSEITPGVSFALDRFLQEKTNAIARETLTRSQALLRVASRIARMGAWAVDLSTLTVTWSEELLAILDLPADHRPEFDYGINIYLPAYRDIVRGVFYACATDGTPFDLEVQAATNAGRVIWVRIIGEAVRESDGSIVGVHGAFEDISNRKATAELIQLRDRAIQAVSQGILITDPMQPDNPIIFASAGFERMTGYRADEVLGRNCRLLQGPDTDPEALATLRKGIAAGQTCAVELLNYTRDGTAFWNQLSISPILGPDGKAAHFVGVLTDVTEQRKLEEQFRQVQKMEAIGHMAGGIAHDFNNLLTVINGCSEDVMEQIGPAHPLRGLVSEIHEAGERAGTLTRQLLAFSRQQVLDPQVIELGQVVGRIEKMLRRVLGESIEFITAFSPDTGTIRADPGQIEQVLMNLALNARDAMPRGGRLTIETSKVHLDQSHSHLFPRLIPGDYVMLAVTDTGVGMDEGTQARIFEPFFTTQGPGKGTGLGLATVHGIVRQSQGHISVYSEAGLGTGFKIYLPCVVESSRETRPAETAPAVPSGTETILLVEDEDAVRAIASRVLRKCGYEVIEAENGIAALKLLDQDQRPIHLLVSDVVMPQMGGPELAGILRARRPDCAVLFVSGYADGAPIRQGVMEGGFAYLQKPFSVASLAQKVRATLDAGAFEPS